MFLSFVSCVFLEENFENKKRKAAIRKCCCSDFPKVFLTFESYRAYPLAINGLRDRKGSIKRAYPCLELTQPLQFRA